MQRPGDDDVVEEAHVQRDEDDREAHAWGRREQRPCQQGRLRRPPRPEPAGCPHPETGNVFNTRGRLAGGSCRLPVTIVDQGCAPSKQPQPSVTPRDMQGHLGPPW